MPIGALAQFVDVTLRFEPESVPVGGTATLRVYAQVVPAERPSSERIFSWYVDLVNHTASVGEANYVALTKPASDKDPLTSSFGFTSGDDRLGIYDTFRIDTPVSKSGIGVNTPVELLSVPVTAVNVGQARFSVKAGSGVQGLAADFIVAPKGGGDPKIGGVYDAATAVLQVLPAENCVPELFATHLVPSPGLNRVTLTFTPCPGRTHVVEFSNQISPAVWAPLPNSPHNSGTLTDTNNVRVRFYRLRVEG